MNKVEQLSEEETERRRDEALRRALNTPPKPREPKPKKPKGKTTKEKPAK
jgi:hypothetical protein